MRIALAFLGFLFIAAFSSAGLHPAAIPVRSEITRRIFTPQSMMGDGIRSATAAVPHGSAEGAVRETSLPPVFPLITAEGPTAPGILSARPGALRQGCPLARGRVRDSGPRVLADPLSDPFRTRASDRTRTGLVDPA